MIFQRSNDKIWKMKINDIVALINLKKEYKSKNLYENVNGIVLKVLPYNNFLVLFLNNKIVGDYAVVEVHKADIKKENIDLPMDFIYELKKTNKLSEENLLKKQSFDKFIFNECDFVELLVEDEKYNKYGIHKGDVGVVAIDYAIDKSILVDFSGVDKNGNFSGDCIAVKTDDLKLIKIND